MIRVGLTPLKHWSIESFPGVVSEAKETGLIRHIIYFSGSKSVTRSKPMQRMYVSNQLITCHKGLVHI